jgi:hypothetical protein
LVARSLIAFVALAGSQYSASVAADPTSAAGVSFQWSAPVVVDDQTPCGDACNMTDGACPSPSLCPGVDSTGQLRSTVDPTGGPTA